MATMTIENFCELNMENGEENGGCKVADVELVVGKAVLANLEHAETAALNASHLSYCKSKFPGTYGCNSFPL